MYISPESVLGWTSQFTICHEQAVSFYHHRGLLPHCGGGISAVSVLRRYMHVRSVQCWILHAQQLPITRSASVQYY